MAEMEAAPPQRPYMSFDAGEITGETNVEGLAFDFNYGARVRVPEGDWRVRLIDRDTCTTLYDAKASNAVVTSTKKYFINFRVEIYEGDQLILAHDYDAARKKVLIKFPVGTLGDIIAWFPYAQVFKYRYDCEVYCAMDPELAALFRPTYPELNFIAPDERPQGLYASYYMGIFFPCDDRVHQPADWRVMGLQKTIPCMLGLDVKEIRPKIVPRNPERRIQEPYVCIAA